MRAEHLNAVIVHNSIVLLVLIPQRWRGEQLKSWLARVAKLSPQSWNISTRGENGGAVNASPTLRRKNVASISATSVCTLTFHGIRSRGKKSRRFWCERTLRPPRGKSSVSMRGRSLQHWRWSWFIKGEELDTWRLWLLSPVRRSLPSCRRTSRFAVNQLLCRAGGSSSRLSLFCCRRTWWGHFQSTGARHEARR